MVQLTEQGQTNIDAGAKKPTWFERMRGVKPEAPAEAAKATELAKTEEPKAAAPDSKIAQALNAQPAAEKVKLKVKKHDVLADTDSLPKESRKSAQAILKRFQFHRKDADIVVNEDQSPDWPTHAVVSPEKDQIILDISPKVASQTLTSGGFFSGIANTFRSHKTNEVLSRLKQHSVLDLGNGMDHDGMDPKLMAKLTDAGVISFQAVFNANDQGVFNAKSPDLLIPKWNLHKMLEYLDKNPPMKGPDLEAFREMLQNLGNDHNLDEVVFIDRVLASKEAMPKFEDKHELGNALRCCADSLSEKMKLLVSGDLATEEKDGPGVIQAQSDQKNYTVIDAKRMRIDDKGEATTYTEPLTYISAINDTSKIPAEPLAMVFSWHHLIQNGKNVAKARHNPKTVQEIRTIHGFNNAQFAQLAKTLNQETTTIEAKGSDGASTPAPAGKAIPADSNN